MVGGMNAPATFTPNPKMEYRRLGRSGLKVSVLSFGSWVTFDTQLNDDMAMNCMQNAWDAGCNFFDNAEAYAGGESEAIMGRVIKQLGWRRQDYVLSTKVFWGIEGGVPNMGNTLNRKYLHHSIEGCLDRLQVDFVDLLFCHRADPNTPLEETVWAMSDLVERGKVLYWGTSEWTADEIRAEYEKNPERFSPNVVLRPLYQEMILPNLSYIGGPSEVPYWLQLKSVFDHYDVPFPILLPRNFALVVTAANQKKIDKLQVGIDEFFDDSVTLKKRYVERISEKSLSLAFEMDEIGEVMQRIGRQAAGIDATLKAVVEAEQAKIMHALSNLEKRIKKAEERNHETAIQQLLGVQDKLFPNGSLQERVENFLSFYKNDAQFLEKVKKTFEPLHFVFNIIH